MSGHESPPLTQEGRGPGRTRKVFLSYARADDEPFVERLRDDLIAADIHVWWDRKSMKNRGRTFLQELRDAIEGADRLIAVIGPSAVESDYVRSEWEHAMTDSDVAPQSGSSR